MAVFGQTACGVHLGLLVVNLATVALIFCLTRDLFNPLAGAIAAAVYSLLSVSPWAYGTAAHATHFVGIFSVAGAWVLWLAIQSERNSFFFASGLSFGMAFMMKQHGIFLSAFAVLTILAHYIRWRPICRRKLLSGLASYAAGAILPYAATCLWLWSAGVFGQFWFWTVTFSGAHVAENSIASVPARFWKGLKEATGPNWPLWVAATLGALLVVRTRDDRNRRWFLCAYAAFSFLCVCPGYFFRQHYFILFLPAVAIFNGVAVVRLIESTRSKIGNESKQVVQIRSFPWLAIAILVAIGSFVVGEQREFLFSWTPEQACKYLYGENPFIESLAIADYVRTHSTPKDQIAILGSEAQICFYAKRLSATGYVNTYELMEPTPFARRLQEEMCREIEAAKPEFLVVVHIGLSWMRHGNSENHIFDWLNRYSARSYRPVGLVDLVSPTRTDYFWGDEAADVHPRSEDFICVLQRKKSGSTKESQPQGEL